MVSDDQIDLPAWRLDELLLQPGARAFRQLGGTSPDRLQMFGKGDSEVCRFDRPPRFVGRRLRPGQRRCRRKQAERQREAAAAAHYSEPSHSRIVGVTNSGTSVCGPCPTPGSTWIVSGPSTHCHVPLSVPFVNGPLSLP